MNDFIDLKGAAHQPIAGNFALVKEDANGFTVVAVGESLDLSQLRSETPKAALRAVTHVYTRLNVARAARMAEHEDLVGRYKPVKVSEKALKTAERSAQA